VRVAAVAWTAKINILIEFFEVFLRNVKRFLYINFYSYKIYFIIIRIHKCQQIRFFSSKIVKR
jgi:hypothetical protein